MAWAVEKKPKKPDVRKQFEALKSPLFQLKTASRENETVIKGLAGILLRSAYCSMLRNLREELESYQATCMTMVTQHKTRELDRSPPNASLLQHQL